jgi:hypothetical protein
MRRSLQGVGNWSNLLSLLGGRSTPLNLHSWNVSDETRSSRFNLHIVHHSTLGQCHCLSTTRLRVSNVRSGCALSKNQFVYCILVIAKCCD